MTRFTAAFAAFFLCLLAAGGAFAQGNATVSGTFTPGHTVRCDNSTCTVMLDAGGAAGASTPSHNYLTELGITNTGLPVCINDALTSNPGGYHRLCFGANVNNSGALFSFDALGGAPSLPWQVEKDGAFYPFPPTGNGNVAGPNSSVIDDFAAFNQTDGKLLKDSGIPRSAVPKGRIIMYPSPTWTSDPTSVTAWSIIPPPGVTVPCVTTNSQCFLETLSVAETKGLSVAGFCSGENIANTQYPFLALTVPINTGALVQRSVRFYDCNITFSPAVTGPNFTVNTGLDGRDQFVWTGQIVGTYNTPSESTFVLLFKPTTCPPAEGCGAIVIQNGSVSIGAVVGATSAGAPAHGAVVGVDASAGNILAMDIQIGEINGCGPCIGTPFHDGFRVFGGNVAGTRGFLRNHVRIGYTHNVVRGVDNGSTDNTDIANPKAYNDNEFILQHVSPGSTAGGCFIDSANRTRIKIYSCNNDTLSPSTYTDALTLTSTSHFVQSDINALGYSNTISTVAGASTPFPVIDSGSANSYVLNGQVVQRWLGADRGSAQAIGAQENNLPILSFVAGTGGTPVSVPTNSFGQITVGTGNPTTVTINFSQNWARSPGCHAWDNQGDILRPTTVTLSSCLFTSNNPLAVGTLVTYEAKGLP